MTYSGHKRFGLSVQEKILSEIENKASDNSDELEVFENLGDRFGWRSQDEYDWIDYKGANFDNAPAGCLPLKWIGGGTLDGDLPEFYCFRSFISRFRDCNICRTTNCN
jgi:hypothetical protein